MTKTTKAIEPKINKMIITPELAKEWLKLNTCNRPLNNRRVEQYAKEWKEGDYHLTTDAIGFDVNGNMNNGQHRLHALIAYGKPLEFFVAMGLPVDTFNFIDTGKLRNAGDVLGANGFESGAHQAAIARWVMYYKKFKTPPSTKIGRRDSFNNDEVLAFALDHKERLRETYDMSYKVNHRFKGLTGGPIGGLYWIFSDIDRESAMAFFSFYATGESLPATSPIFALRQKFIQNMQSNKKYPDADKYAWMILAWNAFRNKRSMTTIRWNPSKDKFPKPI